MGQRGERTARKGDPSAGYGLKHGVKSRYIPWKAAKAKEEPEPRYGHLAVKHGPRQRKR